MFDRSQVFQQALAIRREVGDRAGEGTTLNNIGAVYEAQGRYGAALEMYQQALDTLETVRAASGSEAARAAFIAQHAGLYRRAVALYHRQGQEAEAFYTTERGRARAFLDSLATGYIQLSDNESADLLAREQEAYAARQLAQEALARARAGSAEDARLIANLEARLRQAEQEYAAAVAAIEARGDRLASLIPGRAAVLTLSQVQARLDEQTTLLAYWVMEEQTLAFIITRQSLEVVELDVKETDLIDYVAALRRFPNLEEAHPAEAVWLYRALIAPLRQYLRTTHLAIIPHSVLHYLPFAALSDGEQNLLDAYVITYLPTASALPFIQENMAQVGNRPLILGNPATGDYDAVASLAAERDSLGTLPYAEKEAKAIADLYGVPAHVGAAATESLVRAEAPETGLLHLAAHGIYNPYAPLSSFIALAPDEENDGWLTVEEVYGLDLGQASLVVLSACETNIGQLTAGDELVGLTRAFFYAGAPTVVSSLWSVDDQATAALMERFYTHLRAGVPKAEALRRAQMEIRQEYPSPYYWAAFTLSGDGGQIEEVSGPTTPPAVESGSGGHNCSVLALVLGIGGPVMWMVWRKQSGRAG